MLERETFIAKSYVYRAARIIKENKIKALSGVIVVIFLLVISTVEGFLGQVLFLSLLMLVAVLPLIYKRWLRASLGIEFMLFSIVIAGVTYGPKVGAIFGAIAMILADILTITIGEWTLWNAFAMALGGVVAGLLGKQNIMLTGIAAFFTVEVLRQIPALYLGEPPQKFMTLFYIAVHFLFNLWLFSVIAPLITP